MLVYADSFLLKDLICIKANHALVAYVNINDLILFSNNKFKGLCKNCINLTLDFQY